MPVEVALADAITKATNAEQWSAVAQLVRELEARRVARSPNVIALRTTPRNSTK